MHQHERADAPNVTLCCPHHNAHRPHHSAHKFTLALGTARTTNTLSAGSSTISDAHLSSARPLAVVSYTTATRLLKGVVMLPGSRPYMGLPQGLVVRTGCRDAAAGPNCWSCCMTIQYNDHTRRDDGG